MQKIDAASPDAKSADLVAENITALKALFPELLSERIVDGQTTATINVDVLKGLVGDATVTDAEEKYGLNWHGKRRARQLALTPSAGTLRPCPDESVDWDVTQNLMIEVDNLEVLKLLQRSYAGKVKLIYIDPPYNTGSDFVYPDNFQDNIKNYLELTGQVEGGSKIASNTEASGRFHTDWLAMMYPRLKIARDLLRRDGIVFISINDKELSNLQSLCREVFGEENFIATLVWEKGRKNDARRFSVGHEYLVGYAKELSHIEEVVLPWREAKDGVGEIVERYSQLRQDHGEDFAKISHGLVEYYKSLPEEHPAKKYARSRFVDARGIWRDNNISWPGGGGPRYPLLHPLTSLPCQIPDDGWRFVEETMKEKIAQGYVQFREDHSKPPFLKSYLYVEEPSGGADDDAAGEKLQVMGSVFYRHSQPSTDVMKRIFGEKVFENPKDHIVLARLFRYCAGRSDIIMDFFAGSGTTGHATWELNSSDGGSRKFILVQLPEVLDVTNKEQKFAADYCDKIGRPRTIAELTKERLRRVGAATREQSPLFSGDVGFRVFKLDTSNIRAWNPDRDDLNGSLLKNLEHIQPGRTDDDVLYEILLKLGLDLCVPIERRSVARAPSSKSASGKNTESSFTVHSIGGGVLMACLDASITVTDAEPLALGIVEWHKSQAPAGDTTCIFRDSAFENDVAKSNLAAILEQHGIKQVRSL